MARLIDAGELKGKMMDMVMAGYTAEDMVDAVNEAPTIDPIKHGHWTDRAKSIIGVPTEACSECAEWSIGFDKDYCPCCGARMDKGD